MPNLSNVCSCDLFIVIEQHNLSGNCTFRRVYVNGKLASDGTRAILILGISTLSPLCTPINIHVSLLNADQLLVVHQILAALDEIESPGLAKCRTYFLDGPGCTGKTMIYNTLISLCRCKGFKIAPCAWTGIAATLLALKYKIC